MPSRVSQSLRPKHAAVQVALTDAELLKHDFKIVGRPDTDTSLSSARPPEGEEIRFLRSYDITPPKDLPNRREAQPYVWCALCQEPTHWIGWEAELREAPAGKFLVGQDCARRNGGDMIRRAANDFDARRNRAELLRIRLAVLPIVGALQKAVEEWGASPGCAAISGWRAALRTHAPKHFAELEKAARASPPTFQLVKEFRNFAAEQKRSARNQGREDSDPIYSSRFESIGPIAGPSLYAAPDPTARIRGIAERLNDTRTALVRPTDGVSSRDLGQQLKSLREIADSARELERSCGDYGRGLEDGAIDLLVEWFNALRLSEFMPVKFSRQIRNFVVEVSYNRPVKIAIPAAAPIVRPAEFEALETALLPVNSQSSR